MSEIAQANLLDAAGLLIAKWISENGQWNPAPDHPRLRSVLEQLCKEYPHE